VGVVHDQAEAALAESDADRRRERLVALRKDIRKGEAPADMIAAIEAIRRFWDPDGLPFRQSLRCRSSTNNEDLPGFNGACLYRSTTHHPDEGPLIKSVKKVWASLWNDVAVEEREFWRGTAGTGEGHGPGGQGMAAVFVVGGHLPQVGDLDHRGIGGEGGAGHGDGPLTVEGWQGVTVVGREQGGASAGGGVVMHPDHRFAEYLDEGHVSPSGDGFPPA